MAYRYFAAGYLVKDGKVFLVHHKKFDKWTPPGGHIEENETPDQALIREWKEELSLDVDIMSAYKCAFSGDANATPVPMPFHIDLEREGFEVPHIGYFFYVKVHDKNQKINISERELHGTGWFSKDDLLNLKTFDQVRYLAKFAIDNYPIKSSKIKK